MESARGMGEGWGGAVCPRDNAGPSRQGVNVLEANRFTAISIASAIDKRKKPLSEKRRLHYLTVLTTLGANRFIASKVQGSPARQGSVIGRHRDGLDRPQYSRKFQQIS